MSLTLLKEMMADNDTRVTPTANSNNQNYQTKQKNKRKQNKEDIHFVQKKTRKIDEIREDISLNNKKTKENLRKLLALSKNSVKVKDAEKIFKRAHKGRYIQKAIPKVEKEEESIFTEEDFRAFEEEYFNT